MSDKTTRYSRIEVARETLEFSVAHFTIFSPTERENLHGHNYHIGCEICAPVDDNGLTFDYAVIKRVLEAQCDKLDEQVLLPGDSPYLDIVDEDDYVTAIFNEERIPFLQRDVTVLPIANTTVEELSHYLLQEILRVPELKDRGIVEITVKVSSNPGQSGAAHWSADVTH